MVDIIPQHLTVARRYLGVEEIRGSGDNATILGFVTKIAAAFPDQASYVANYTHDDIAWCGLFAADCFAECGIKGPFGSSDTDKFLWADAWKTWGQPSGPRVGAVVCFGGHVAFVNRLIDADTFEAIGGNQSSPQGGAVTLSRRRWSDVKATRWPYVSAVVVVPPPGERPEIKLGSTGPAVLELQRLLGIVQTGVFDLVTDAKVREFQASRGLDVDGEVGVQTWPALLAATATGRPSKLTPKTIDAIVAAAASSDLARYNWRARGHAPIGYTKGMAVTYGMVYAKYKAGDSAAMAMAVVPPASSKDALELYADALFLINPNFRKGGVDTLRAIFVLLTGLGMRESSGNCFEGRDMSASNVTADTCEAGLFQQSWNSHTSSPEILKLFMAYRANQRPGLLEIFREGVTPKSTQNFGTGDGAEFQQLAKSMPAFAAEVAAVGLRVLRTHWGPIIRQPQETEVRPEADTLFRQVQAIVDAQPLDGDIIPPTKLDDELLIALIFMLTEGDTMDANIKAKMIAELGKPNPDMRALLLQALGASGTTLPPPSPPPPPPPPPFDFTPYLPLMQSPIVQQLLGGKSITIGDLLPLIPAILAISSGQPVPALPPPVKPPVTPPPAPVVVVPPPASNNANNWSAGMAAALVALGLSGAGVTGSPIPGDPNFSMTGLISFLGPLVTAGIAPWIGPFVSNIFSKLTAPPVKAP